MANPLPDITRIHRRAVKGDMQRFFTKLMKK